MHIILNFYQFFTIFANFYQFWPNFEASILFFQFILIDNNLSSVLYFRLPSICNFLCNFLCQNVHNAYFFTNFDQFGLILWHSYFFFFFFSIDNNLFCILYFGLSSFYNFLGIFLCQNSHNTNFLQIFLNFC